LERRTSQGKQRQAHSAELLKRKQGLVSPAHFIVYSLPTKINNSLSFKIWSKEKQGVCYYTGACIFADVHATLLGISHASRVAHGSSAAKCVGQWMNSIA
jgi:hypothetical protein